MPFAALNSRAGRSMPVLRSLMPGTLALLLLVAAPLARATLPIQHWVQPSGARVYLIENPSIPMVDVQIDFDAGQRRAPADRIGLLSAMTSMLYSGLTPRDPGRGAAAIRSGFSGRYDGRYDGAMDENALSEAWTELGASLAVSAGDDRLSATLRSLTEPDLLARAVALAARQLGEPSFPADQWARDQARKIASLRESLTRPGTMASRAWYAAVFGDHPYGYMSTEASMRRITVQDLRDFHRRHLNACRARITLVGAVTRVQADRIAAELLARLPEAGQGACPPLAALPEVKPLTAPVNISLPLESAQAHVLIGQPGLRRSDPDYLAMLVGNYILGAGGFVSRLTQEVRDKRGLSYSVNSNFAPGLQVGSFWVGLQTRPDQAQQAVDVVRAELARFVAEGPTEAEMRAAKDNLVGGFALRIDSNRKLLDNVAAMAWNDLPLDYLDTWTAKVEAITREQVRAAFARKLQPARMVTVIVGGKPARLDATAAPRPAL